VLVTREMVESMKPGSLIVDMAVERGGNCPLSKAGETVEHKGVAIVAPVNIAGQVAGNASHLYAKNLQNFLDLIITDGAVKLDWEDEIVKGCGLSHDGALVHPLLSK